MKRIFLCLGVSLCVLFSSHIWGADVKPVTVSYMPDNDLWKEDDKNKRSNITEELFNEIIQLGYQFYNSFAEEYNETLQINNRWDDPTVNANVSRFGAMVTINMYGGLARRDEVTPDAFALVLCHELAHAYGGVPYLRPYSKISAEGQSDYYGAKTCLKKVFTELPTDGAFYDPTPIMEEKCAATSDRLEDYNMCLRGLHAGFSLGHLLSTFKVSDPIPSFETPDTQVVSSTQLSYPDTTQCRLDTYMVGTLDLARPCCWFKGTDEMPCIEVAKMESYIQTTEWVIDDTLGNGDGFIQPGEKISLALTLSNGGLKAATDIDFKVTSDSDLITMLEGEFTLPEIGSGQNASYEGILFEVDSTIPCGSEFTLTVTATYGTHVNTSSHIFKVGKRVFQGSMTEMEPIIIPDKDPAGIVSELEVPFGVDQSNLSIPVEILHSFVGDLKITLTDPDGLELTLRDRSGFSADDIKGSFGKDLESVDDLSQFNSPTPGTWVLKVSDHAASDIGTLVKWGVELEHMVCE